MSRSGLALCVLALQNAPTPFGSQEALAAEVELGRRWRIQGIQRRTGQPGLALGRGGLG